MVNDVLKQDIVAFIKSVGEPIGIPVDPCTHAVAARVRTHYLPTAHSRDEVAKRRALEALKAGWEENQDHQHIHRWGRAAINVAIFCLVYTDMAEIKPDQMSSAVDAVVRFSGWYHTDSNLWRRFQPYATIVVDELWGGIDSW